MAGSDPVEMDPDDLMASATAPIDETPRLF